MSHIRAVLFDIDGTLIDSNYLHIDAWSRAFAELERPVDAWRVHRSIGMDSALLLEELLGPDAGSLGDAAKAAHARHYAATADRLRAFAHARELLADLDARGIRVVLATSAPQEELDLLLPVLDAAESVDVVTSAEDADTAKPAPDILQTAVERAGVDTAEALMVGDAVWDMKAAGRAGIIGIGVLSGGTGRSDLLAAGAARVYSDVAELRADLDPLLAER